jgi:benzylsuccinate CoA-transferase BbsF subunit
MTRFETQPGGIYRDLKILELGSGAAGPVSTRYFAEQGAHVVRVESARRPDFLRMLNLTQDSPKGLRPLDSALMFVLLNSDKDSVSINTNEPEGVALVKRLALWADVVAENFSPGVVAKWGLDYESLRVEKPDLIMLSGCLFGQTGPQRKYPGFGGQGSAISGFNHLTGWPDREAHGPHATITDSLSPRYVAAALAAALLQRKRTGRGQYIDVSQIETAVYSLSELVVRYSANGEGDERRGNRDEWVAPHGVYPCRPDADGERWIAIACHTDDDWQRLVAVLGSPAWATRDELETAEGRLRHQDGIDREIASWTAEREAYVQMQELQGAGVEAGVVQSFADLARDPQLAARDHFVPLGHEYLDELAFERSAIRLAEHPGALRRPGPKLGEHNDEVLGEILGLSRTEIEDLIARDVVV